MVCSVVEAQSRERWRHSNLAESPSKVADAQSPVPRKLDVGIAEWLHPGWTEAEISGKSHVLSEAREVACTGRDMQ